MLKKILFVIILLNTVAILNAENNIKGQFDQKYRMWKEFMASNKAIFLTDTTGRQSMYFDEIIKLGPSAVPYIIEKMKTDPVLWYAVRVISKKCFEKHEWNETNNDKDAATLFLNWYNYGRFQTSQQFEKLYTESKNLKKVTKIKESETKENYQMIKNLGIDALPYMVEKVKQGDTNLIPIISELADGEIKSTAKPAECIEWWQKNKEKWTLPPIKSKK